MAKNNVKQTLFFFHIIFINLNRGELMNKEKIKQNKRNLVIRYHINEKGIDLKDLLEESYLLYIKNLKII